MSKQDIDKLLALGKAMNEVVHVGELMFKDGKINLEDIVHTPALYNAVANVVKASKDYKEMVEEIKDIDAIEAINLLNQILLNK